MVALSPDLVPHVPLLRVWVAGCPVSANRMYGARGRYTAAKRLTAAAWEWRDTVAYSVMRWRVSERAPRPALAISYTVVGVRGDTDGYAKVVCDGLAIGLAVDARYFVRVSGERRKAERRGQCGALIEVWRLDAMKSTESEVRS